MLHIFWLFSFAWKKVFNCFLFCRAVVSYKFYSWFFSCPGVVFFVVAFFLFFCSHTFVGACEVISFGSIPTAVVVGGVSYSISLDFVPMFHFIGVPSSSEAFVNFDSLVSSPSFYAADRSPSSDSGLGSSLLGNRSGSPSGGSSSVSVQGGGSSVPSSQVSTVSSSSGAFSGNSAATTATGSAAALASTPDRSFSSFLLDSSAPSSSVESSPSADSSLLSRKSESSVNSLSGKARPQGASNYNK